MSTPKPLPKSSLPHTHTLVQAFLTDRQDRQLSQETIRWYKRFLTAFATAYKELPDQDQITPYLEKSGYTEVNLDNALKAITTFYHWLQGTGDKNASLSMPDNSIGKMATAFLESSRYRGISASTLRWYSSILTRFASAQPELPDKPEVIEAFIFTFDSSDQRRHGCYRTLRTFFNWLTERYNLSTNPMRGIKPPKREHKEKMPLSLKQLQQLLEYPGHSKEIRAMLYVMADNGVRIGEVCSITSDGISPTGAVHVRGKTGERIVPINAMVYDMLMDLGRVGKLFPRSVYYYRRMITQAFKNVGLKGSPHVLRHTMASHWTGGDLALKTVGGWKSWSMLEVYSHGRFEKAKQEHLQHSPIARLYGDNGNGHKTELGNNTPASLPSHRQDDLAIILSKYSNESWAFWDIARAKYYLHALLYNFARRLLEVSEGYAESGDVPEFCIRSLIKQVRGEHLCDKEEMDDMALVEEVVAGGKEIWSMIANLIRPVIVDHQTQALVYKQLSSEEVEPEVVELTDKNIYPVEESLP